MAELTWHKKHPTSGDQPHYQLITTAWYSNQASHYSSPSADPIAWYNQLIHGDNQHILPFLLQQYTSAINLIYIDPPFMTGRTFTNDSRVAYRDTWNNDLDRYLQWLYELFQYLYLLLAEEGSFYVHLDWRVVHYAKILLDEIFGFSPNIQGPGFKNEIIWHYQSGGRSQKHFARKHDTLLFYTKSARYCFHPERVSERRGAQKRNHMRREVDGSGRVTWTIRSAGRLYTYSEDALMTPSDVWTDIQHLHQKSPERIGYATQKPEALLERIISVSSDENDLVLDCFCGSGVTPVVANRLQRRWIACDNSELALAKTRERLLAQATLQPLVLQQLSTVAL